MRFSVKLKFTEKRAEYLLGLGDPEKPFQGVISGELAETEANMPRYDDETLFNRCQPLQGTLTHYHQLHIGGASLPTNYTSPYPMTYNVLCVCEYCLKYMNSDYSLRRHKLKCPGLVPPGTEIYHDDGWSVWEVDGALAKVYCQNLCLLAKLFLESKTLYYDVEPFNFYVLTRHDGFGHKFAGYFSKQKIYCNSLQEGAQINNVSCIMVLPLSEYRGFGQFLIAFSYLLTRVQMVTGTPEKPLSFLGARSYETYWRYAVSQYFCDLKGNDTTIRAISDATQLTLNDVIYTLETLGWLVDGKRLVVDFEAAETTACQWEKRQPLLIKQNKLMWSA